MSYNDYSIADIAVAAGGNRNGGGWGGDWSSWIILFLIFGMFGWGGFGGFGGGMFGGGMNSGVGSEVQRGFDHSSVVTKLDGLVHGQCDSTYAINNAVTTGFSNAELGAANRQAALMQQLFGMQSAADKCCCETREAIQGVRYDLATQACDTRNLIQTVARDIIDNQNSNARAILDAQNQNYIRGLEGKVNDMTMAAYFADLKAYNRATAEANTVEILNRTAPIPRPAYNVPNPYTGQYGYGRNPCRDNCHEYAA